MDNKIEETARGYGFYEWLTEEYGEPFKCFDDTRGDKRMRDERYAYVAGVEAALRWRDPVNEPPPLCTAVLLRRAANTHVTTYQLDETGCGFWSAETWRVVVENGDVWRPI